MMMRNDCSSRVGVRVMIRSDHETRILVPYDSMYGASLAALYMMYVSLVVYMGIVLIDIYLLFH